MSSTGGVVLDLPVVDELVAACTVLAKADPAAVWRLADTDVARGLSLLVQLQARTAALQSVLLGEAETRDLKAGTGAPSTQRWLADTLRLSRADGGARLRQSAALRRHPQVLAALAAGSLTVEQGEVLAAVLHQVEALPGLQDPEVAAAGEFLIEQAALLGPRELTRAGQAVIEALTRTPSVDDPADQQALAREHDRAERDLQDAERNWLRVTRRPNGRLRIGLDLGPVGAAGFLAWCRHADTPATGQDGFQDTRSRAERRGDALVDLLHHGTTPDQPPSEAGDGDGSDPDGSDGSDGSDPVGHPSRSSERVPERAPERAPGRVPGRWAGVTLSVVTTLAELRAGIPGTAHLDTGAPLSVAALRALACEAQIVPAVMNGPSQVLDLGRACREFNRAQRRAAALRDRGCVAPGCHAPPSDCHLHHARWWIRGGPTDLDNAALLCGFHHRMVHRQDWAITLAPNGFPQLHPPPAIDPTGRPRQHHRFTLPDHLGHHAPPGTQRCPDGREPLTPHRRT